MIRLLIALALVLLGLIEIDRRISQAATAERAASAKVEPVVDPRVLATLELAGVSITLPGSTNEVVYGRRDGAWIALNHHGAFADAQRIAALANAVLASKGVVRTREWARGPAYGLKLESRVIVELLDTKLQPVVAVEFGDPVPGLSDGVFARRVGEPAILALDVDPKQIVLGSLRPGLPPLADPYVIPATDPLPWGNPVEIALANHGTDVVRLHQVPLPEDEREGLPEGAPDWRWEVETSDAARPTAAMIGYHYAAFVRFLEARRIYAADAEAFPSQGIGPGSPRLEIRFDEGDPLRLLIGGPTPDGLVYVLNNATGRLYGVDPAHVPLLQPTAAQLTVEDPDETVWMPYLR